MTAADDLVREVLPTVLIGSAGAALFWLIGFPAAMLTGPAVAVSVASLMGVKTAIPPRLRDAVYLLLGVQIGSTVTPEVIATVLTLPVSLAVLTGTLLISMVLVSAMLSRGFGYDRMTALLAATPGHLSYALGLSAELRADVTRVALVQSVRVLMLTILVPVIIALWGVEGTAGLAGTQVIHPVALALTLCAALAVGLVLMRLGVPAPLLLGAMAVSAVGHGSDLTPGSVPSWLTVAAFVLMGSLIGTRFSGLDLRGLAGAALAGAAATVIACGLAAMGAWLVAEFVGLRPATLLLAFAPGGVEVMAALAIETGLDPAVVAAHHVFRLVVLSVVVPLFIVRIRRP